MEQFLNSENYFPGNIIELTDSQQCDEESSNQSKPPDQITLKNLRLRKNNRYADKIYWNCVQYTKLFIEYLEQQGYTNINDYLLYCNKKGILLEQEILKINQINTQKVKYDIFQCKTIHNRNYDYRNIQELVENMKKLKKTIKYEEKNKQNVTIQFFYIDNQNECTTIHQTKQNRYIAPNTINKLLYDVQPLDVEIDQKVIKNCLESYLSFHKECLDSFSKDQQKIRATELENEESETNIIDYDQLSDDSLAPHFKIAPSQRQSQFQSKKFNQITKKIKILKNSSSFKI